MDLPSSVNKAGAFRVIKLFEFVLEGHTLKG